MALNAAIGRVDYLSLTHIPISHTYFGDADLDREFDSSDLISALAAGTYESNVNAGWAPATSTATAGSILAT